MSLFGRLYWLATCICTFFMGYVFFDSCRFAEPMLFAVMGVMWAFALWVLSALALKTLLTGVPVWDDTLFMDPSDEV